MGHGSDATLPYASGSTATPRPTRHSLLAGLSWGMVTIEVLFRGGTLAYAQYRSPTYPMERFYRNVGDPDLFLRLDRDILVAGAVLALLALVWPNRKRRVAWTVLVAHLFLLNYIGNVLTIYRY